MRGTAAVSVSVLRKRWDCVFRVRDTFEAQMLATYVANAPKPIRIMWIGTDIPRALWQKWNSDITLLGCSEGVIGCEWEAIFFPLNFSAQATEKILIARGVRNLAGNMASEIAANGAALVWSNINTSQGELYWYDPSEGEVEKISGADAVSMLEEVIELMKH